MNHDMRITGWCPLSERRYCVLVPRVRLRLPSVYIGRWIWLHMEVGAQPTTTDMCATDNRTCQFERLHKATWSHQKRATCQWTRRGLLSLLLRQADSRLMWRDLLQVPASQHRKSLSKCCVPSTYCRTEFTSLMFYVPSLRKSMYVRCLCQLQIPCLQK